MMIASVSVYLPFISSHCAERIYHIMDECCAFGSISYSCGILCWLSHQDSTRCMTFMMYSSLGSSWNSSKVIPSGQTWKTSKITFVKFQIRSSFHFSRCMLFSIFATCQIQHLYVYQLFNISCVYVYCTN